MGDQHFTFSLHDWQADIVIMLSVGWVICGCWVLFRHARLELSWLLVWLANTADLCIWLANVFKQTSVSEGEVEYHHKFSKRKVDSEELVAPWRPPKPLAVQWVNKTISPACHRHNRGQGQWWSEKTEWWIRCSSSTWCVVAMNIIKAERVSLRLRDIFLFLCNRLQRHRPQQLHISPYSSHASCYRTSASTRYRY